MRVSLINPAFSTIYGPYQYAARVGATPQMPLGLCYLAGAARRAGHEVQLIDAEAEGYAREDDLIDEIESFRPDAVGFTATTPLIPEVADLTKKVKRRLPGAFTIVGGVHVSSVLEQIYSDRYAPEADVCVYGEGENTLVAVLKAHEAGAPLEGVPGILFRRNGEVVKTPSAEPPVLDDLEIPARDLLKVDRYQWSIPGKGIQAVTSLITMRGCPFQCAFCEVSKIFPMKVRYRSDDAVVDEIELIQRQFGIRHLMIQDDTLTLSRKHSLALAKRIRERGVRLTFEGYTRADLVDEELLVTLKEAGLVRLSFGVESGSDEILKAIRKGTTTEMYRMAYKLCKKIGIETRCSFMIGHPHETKETVKKTIAYINSLDVYQAYVNVATPYPGTELYEMARDGVGGLKLLSTDWKEYRRYGNPVIEVNDLTAQDLKRLQRHAYLRFYLRPRIILYNLRRAGWKAAFVNMFAFARSILASLLPKPKEVAAQPASAVAGS